MNTFQCALDRVTTLDPLERIRRHSPSDKRTIVIEPQIKMVASIIAMAVYDKPFSIATCPVARAHRSRTANPLEYPAFHGCDSPSVTV